MINGWKKGKSGNHKEKKANILRCKDVSIWPLRGFVPWWDQNLIRRKKILAVIAQGEARDSQTVEACHTYCAIALWENNECPCGPEYGHLPLNGKRRDCFDSNLQREQPWECVYLHVCMWMCKLDTERSELLSYSVLWAYGLQRSACFNRQSAGGNYIFTCCVVTCRLDQAKPSFGSLTKNRSENIISNKLFHLK